jgi:hypothetical protein
LKDKNPMVLTETAILGLLRNHPGSYIEHDKFETGNYFFKNADGGVVSDPATGRPYFLGKCHSLMDALRDEERIERVGNTYRLAQ